MKYIYHPILSFVFILFLPLLICAQEKGRVKSNINKKWFFHQAALSEDQRNDPGLAWELVDIPHSFNTEDPFDDIPGYYRGEVWYRRSLNISDFHISGKYFLYFEAINQEASIFVNKEKVGTHFGGYTAFCVDISEAIHTGDNLLEIKVDNKHNPNIPPLKGDFNFYGGIYRDVYLVKTNSIHFEMQDHGSSGVYVNTPSVNSEHALLEVLSTVINSEKAKEQLTLQYILRNNKGETVLSEHRALMIEKRKTKIQDSFDIDKPILWDFRNPHLYTLDLILRDGSNEIIDRITQKIGFRYYHFDPDKGFYLNGKSVKLLGVNRHQDMPGKGNALSNADHWRDVRMIKQMGSNFLRTAHYPQDPAILEACDSLGLLVSMEIPLDHEINKTEIFDDNCKLMMTEMIRQYYNHPSIIIWAYMNEMFLGKKLQRDKQFINDVVKLARELENLSRAEDPYRYTMIPNHGDFDIYYQSGLTDIPMIVGWNLYYGWYSPDFQGLTEFLSHAHTKIPDKAFIISEYGAGADPRIRNDTPKRFDFSIDWQNEFHKSHISQIKQMDFVAGAAVWNMFDFGSENRQDAVPNINSKGLCTFDRQPKEAFFIYRDSLAGSISLDIYERDVLLDLSTRINYGTEYIFTSDTLLQWMPEMGIDNKSCFGGMEYSPRSIGYGSARAIAGSTDDPLYQTQIIGPDSLVFNVIPGYNTIELLFAELEQKEAGERVFDVLINDEFLFSNIDLAGQYGSYKAVKKKITIEISDNRLKIVFVPHKGEALINAIQIAPKL